ncbi:MAG: sodium:proton antiporter [Candidatus Cardinium sp.]|uniref:sodium:proton antiporter n=1 Tax=Cardinium endosymbiont of Dermatophagoides farinae TaxID=2597823 RepID=UPI0011826675|nr:sodium:proton antiporter [Cardinium endosymbiont of Dermatophagoides farinae]TSJ80701.1 citrate transporter [Cardinium endosymbiont of Dermatophagoides farinae]UWW96695.1 MAG: sodium:proton antiporter [Candidatus Cardinium sp.]
MFATLPLLCHTAATLSKGMEHSLPTDGSLMTPSFWLAIPFIALLLMIATGPLFFAGFWHKHYAKVAILLATFVMAYYCIVLENKIKPIEAAAEYIQFMALITALYMATGGISIKVATRATPLANILLLFIGALFANLIGTTGASMLFIRPYLGLNKGRIKVYHIVFFIFIVSNIGGALTPIGDPPLFLGFLKGVPFEWTLIHNSLPWCIALLMLLSIFYFFERNNRPLSTPNQVMLDGRSGIVSIAGSKNLIWLVIVIGGVFLDPTIFPWLPTIDYHGHTISFVRELIMLTVATLSYYSANKAVLLSNGFSFAPLNEVCLIFIGIFGTMIPALELIGKFAASEVGKQLITPTTLYWGTGLFSSVLDNAPTYLNFVAASMAAQGADIEVVANVQAYAAGAIYPDSVTRLSAIALASVFFGAMTYIGNGPNFMVKAIAEQAGIAMPPFGNYIFRFSMPILLPILFVIWFFFFAS